MAEDQTVMEALRAAAFCFELSIWLLVGALALPGLWFTVFLFAIVFGGIEHR